MPLSIAVMTTISLTMGQVSHASDNLEPGSVDGSDSSWHVDFNSWLWMMGIEGTVGIGPLRVNTDASFGDVLDASDSLMAFSGRLEAGKGPFTGYVDGLYANIGVDDLSGPAGISSIDVTQELGIIDFGLMYRVYEGDLMGEKQPHGLQSSIDVYGGARYTTLTLELEPALLNKRSGSKDWIDPIVGVKLIQPISDRLDFETWGDIGGFGVSSDFTWSATAVLAYDTRIFDMSATLYGGYRAIGWDYTEGSGPRAFEWDVVLHGPTLGMTIRF
jgi:hypothetical protein